MAVNISPADVRLILDTQLGEAQLGAFIQDATLIVEEDIEPLGELSAERLKRIAVNLAAHFATIRQRQVKSERTADGGLTVSYMGQDGKGLESSLYGQAALTLDTTGILSNLQTANKRPFIDNSI